MQEKLRWNGKGSVLFIKILKHFGMLGVHAVLVAGPAIRRDNQRR